MTPDATILDALPDPIFFVDRRGAVAYLNRACEAAFGLPAERLEGQALSEILAGDLDEGLRALLSRAHGEVTPASLPAIRIGGAY